MAADTEKEGALLRHAVATVEGKAAGSRPELPACTGRRLLPWPLGLRSNPLRTHKHAHVQGNQVVGILSDEADPAVNVMKVEHAPTESYADVGGLEQQIQAGRVGSGSLWRGSNTVAHGSAGAGRHAHATAAARSCGRTGGAPIGVTFRYTLTCTR